MTVPRLATAVFIVTTLGAYALPAYAQRADRRHGGGGGGGQHAVARGGGRDAQPQAQRGSRGRESRQQAQPQSRSSVGPPHEQVRSQERERRPQAQPRDNVRQSPQVRSAPQQRSWQGQPRGASPRGRVESSQRYEAPRYATPRPGAQRYEAPHYGGQRPGAPRYATPRSYGPGPGYGYRSGYNGHQPYNYRAYAPPHGWRPHGYGPRWSLNFYFGRPYGYYGYDTAAYGYYALTPGFVYGAVRIVDAPPEAQVFVDGYYAGVVDDYDGVFQHLNLVPGSHRIEIQVYGFAPIGFDVFVQPGETITYRANIY